VTQRAKIIILEIHLFLCSHKKKKTLFSLLRKAVLWTTLRAALDIHSSAVAWFSPLRKNYLLA